MFKAFTQMHENHFRHLGVTEDKKVVGVLSIKDIAQYICSQEGKKAKFRTESTRTIISYTTADFDCVPLSSNTKTSRSVSNLPAPPDYK